MVEGDNVSGRRAMAEPSSLRELRVKELTTLKERVAKRIRIKPSTKRVRRIAGVDIMLTPQASKVHICACLVSFPKLEVLEEAIATDELDMLLYRHLGPLVFVPLVLSVLKMLKRKVDVIAVREPALGEEIPLASSIRNAGVRVRAWEREWRRVNLERR
jgi:ppGpp synthetase/RelA/SpoT-type nucleotidyltranferase